MSLKTIEQLLKPNSIAVIGASNQPNRPGNAVMRNLLQGQFNGPIMPVTPHYKAVNGVLAYRSIDELPIIPLLNSRKLIPVNTTYWTGWPTAENDYWMPTYWWAHALEFITHLEKAE